MVYRIKLHWNTSSTKLTQFHIHRKWLAKRPGNIVINISRIPFRQLMGKIKSSVKDMQRTFWRSNLMISLQVYHAGTDPEKLKDFPATTVFSISYKIYSESV